MEQVCIANGSCLGNTKLQCIFSSREPAQVFSLLGAIFGAFDEIARRRGVFKVETVGSVIGIGSVFSTATYQGGGSIRGCRWITESDGFSRSCQYVEKVIR